MVSSVVGGFERYSSLKSFKSAILELVIRLLIVVSLEYCVPPSFVRSVEVFWFVGAAVRFFFLHHLVGLGNCSYLKLGLCQG